MPVCSWAFKEVTMGEGMTPLIRLEQGLLAKIDYIMPTLSFKDRGAVVLIANALEQGVKHVIQDSSGNAGISIAAYAARAGIKADIYLGSSTPAKKIKMIESYGANVIMISGSREDVATAALKEVAKGEKFYASHVYNPLFVQGMKTYIFEVFEQLEGKLPENIFVPLGNGTLFFGVYLGIKDLISAGLVTSFPNIIAIQAEACAPIYQSWVNSMRSPVPNMGVPRPNMGVPRLNMEPVVNKGTVADGIAIANPARGNEILEIIEEINAKVITVTDQEILSAHSALAKKGFHVELTSAANYAGYKKLNLDSSLITLCGASK